MFIETICALDATSHPDANRHVLAQLTNPTNDRAFVGGLLACVRKLEAGHFSPPQTRAVAAVVSSLLNDTGSQNQDRVLAVEVLRRLPADMRRIPRSLGSRTRQVDVVLASGRLAAGEAAQASVERITNASVAQMPGDVLAFDDRILPDLVDQMLFSPIPDVRLYVATLIQVTPYRMPVAAALVAELVRRRLIDLPVGPALALIEGLRTLGGPTQRRLLEHVVGEPGAPPQLRTAAAFAVGHVAAPAADDQAWIRIVNPHAQRWRQQHSNVSASILTGLIYGLGIARNDTLLRSLRDHPQMPHPVRTTASWWLNIPQCIYESANR